MSNTINSFSTKKISLFFSFFAAVLILISSIGKPLLPPSTNLTLDDVDLIVTSDNGSIIADNDLDRLIFVNPDGQIVNVKSFAADNIKADQANKVFISKDRVYVIAGQKLANGFYYRTERLLEYSLNGDFIREIYKLDQPSYKQKSFITLDNLRVGENNSLNLTYINENRVFFVNPRSEENVPRFSIAFPEIIRHVLLDTKDSNSFLAYGLSGSCYYYDDKQKQITTLKREDAIKRYIEFHQLPDDTGEIFSNPDNMFPLTSISFRNNQLYYCDRFQELHQVKCASKIDTIIKELPYSNFMLLKIAAFWLSVAYLCLALLYFLFSFIFSICNVIRTLNNTNHIDLKEHHLFSKYVRDLLAILLIAATIIGFYTHSTFKSVNENYDKISQNQLQQISILLEKYQPQLLKELAETNYTEYIHNPVKRRQLIDFQAFLKDYSDSIGKDSGIYCEIYLHDPKGNCISIFDLTNIDMAGSINHELSKNWGDIQEENFRYDEETTAGTYCYFYQKLRTPDGKELGVIELGYLKDKLITEQRDRALNSFLNLLSLLILFYITKEFIHVFRKNFSDWNKYKKIIPEEAGAYWANISVIFLIFILYVDFIAYVYVIQEFCRRNPDIDLTFAATLTVFLNYAGAIIGPILIKYLLPFFTHRNFFTCAGLGTILGCITMGISLPLNNFPLFLIGNTVKSFMIGFFDSTNGEIPLMLKDEQKRFEIFQKSGQLAGLTKLFIIILGAFTIEILGFSTIYYLSAAAAIFLTAIYLIAFKQKDLSKPITKEFTISDKTKSNRVFTSKEGIIFILCCLLPFYIFYIYDSYVFPLYAVNSGLSLLLLSNLSVISLAAFAIFSSQLSKLKNKLGRRNALVMIISIISACYISFSISPTIWWAIIVLMIKVILINNGDLWSYLSAMLETRNTDFSSANRYLVINKNIIKTSAVGLMGLALSLGPNTACIITGIACLILVLIFFFNAPNYQPKNN